MSIQYDPATGMPMPPGPTQQAPQTVQPAIAGVPQQFVEVREHYFFTIPKEMLPLGWSRQDEDRTFAMTPLSASEEEAALRFAASSGTFDPGQMGKHWMLSSIFAIGSKYTGRNHDTITKWLDDVGPKARKLVDKAFTHLHNITEKQGEDFLAGMRRAGQ